MNIRDPHLCAVRDVQAKVVDCARWSGINEKNSNRTAVK